jgi:hypothetical protein
MSRLTLEGGHYKMSENKVDTSRVVYPDGRIISTTKEEAEKLLSEFNTNLDVGESRAFILVR